MSYLDTAKDFYEEAAETPKPGLCCTSTPKWAFPELVVPRCMDEMNYGCGTTVHPRDLAESPAVLYVGVGGGLEVLQFAYFSRRAAGVVGVDPVARMREACRDNLTEAARVNAWFRGEFVDIRDGDALRLPLEDASIDVAAQNCLFNILEPADLDIALAEMHRVLRPGGRLVMSDPIAPRPLPAHLAADDRLRAMCLSGATTYEQYVARIVGAGFGTIEIRARRPYRVLDPKRYGTPETLLLESLELAAIKDPIPPGGPCVFTGRVAIYFGDEEALNDGAGHILARDTPLAVCDKTAEKLERLGRTDLVVTPPSWFYDGGGCC